MIPKTIHYCWFGGNELPDEARRYIAGWKEQCPEYEIVEWNEDTFDVSSVPYVKEAYEARKWAFVTDYVRLYALYTRGGIYMDTDVEVVRPLDAFLGEEAFSGFERSDAVPTGIMASVKGHDVVKELLDDYRDRHFLQADGSFDLTTNVEVITSYFVKKGLKLDNTKQTVSHFTLYPTDYFCPKDSRTLEINCTKNTFTIHHFSGSWLPPKSRWRNKVKRALGPGICKAIAPFIDRANQGRN